MKKTTALLLVLLFIFVVSPLRVNASSGIDSAEISAKASELCNKYFIDIKYPGGEQSITMNHLNTLDQALSTVTAPVVQQVSEYYRQKNGQKLSFSYVYSNTNLSESRVALMAGFDSNRSLIELYIPMTSGMVMVAGDSPINIVHEFGHAMHLMFTDSYGFQRMEQEWQSFNEGIAYNEAHISKNPDNRVFVSGYAATDFAEDVADTLGHAFVRNKSGQGFTSLLSVNGNQTGLGKKIAYLESMLARCFPDNEQVLQNFRKLYNAPSAVKYQGLTFSGDYLQYSNYPQPRYILQGNLNSLGKTCQDAIWITALGGWHVVESNGRGIIIFPGGSWCETGTNFQLSAST